MKIIIWLLCSSRENAFNRQRWRESFGFSQVVQHSCKLCKNFIHSKLSAFRRLCGLLVFACWAIFLRTRCRRKGAKGVGMGASTIVAVYCCCTYVCVCVSLYRLCWCSHCGYESLNWGSTSWRERCGGAGSAAEYTYVEKIAGVRRRIRVFWAREKKRKIVSNELVAVRIAVGTVVYEFFLYCVCVRVLDANLSDGMALRWLAFLSRPLLLGYDAVYLFSVCVSSAAAPASSNAMR